jgi:antirestriction protein ArdC
MNREDVLKQSEVALNELSEALSQGRSDTLVRYLEMLSRFHEYSWGNCVLISIQRPDATRVAGFQRWKRLGRYVKKGEKGIHILAPIIRKTEQAEDDGEVDSDVRRLRGFRVAYVFDVSQTEGRELAEFSRIVGDPGEKLHRLEAFVRRRGIELKSAEHLGGADGRSEGGKITIRTGMPPAESFSVLAHEVAHELLHRSARRNETTRQVRELEAEAVSFVVSKAVGLDGISRSADYIQLYSGDKALLLQSLEHIQRVASSIIEELNDSSNLDAAAAA